MKGFFFSFFFLEEGGRVNTRIMQMQVDSLPSKISLYNPPDDLNMQYGLIFSKVYYFWEYRSEGEMFDSQSWGVGTSNFVLSLYFVILQRKQGA